MALAKWGPCCRSTNLPQRMIAETRALYLQDVVRAPEWRKILQDFDKKWGTVSTSTPTPSTATPVQEVSAAPGPSEVPSDAQPQSGSSWEGMFPEEPTNMDALTQTYGPGAHTFTVTSTLTAIVVEGPKLFLVGNGTATFNTDEPILMRPSCRPWVYQSMRCSFNPLLWTNPLLKILP